MGTLTESLNEATAILYRVAWWPSDWGLNHKDALTSYVCATSMDEATGRLTSNPFDIKSVVCMGHVIETRKAAP